MIKSLKSFDLKDKRVLLRVDFNVPISNNNVIDDFRIVSSLPTIKYCLKSGAKIIIMSHLGRPGGKVVPEMSLISVGELLADRLEMPIKFSEDCVSEDSHDVTLGLRSGEIHLLENLRFHSEEESNEKEFSSKLAKHGEIYINDAFGTAHRSHASNNGVTKYFLNKGMGLLFEKELEFLTEKLAKPNKPLTIILGGAKIDTKLDLINHFLTSADNILIGGGMAFTFLKARGVEIGNSLVDSNMINEAKNILNRARGKINLLFPTDVVCAKTADNTNNIKVYNINDIPTNIRGLDIGPNTIKQFSEIISKSGTIFWNGPMGVFEIEGFHHGTEGIANIISDLIDKNVTTIVGGGDSVAAINQFSSFDKFSHVSSGGGASLELLTGNPLPSIYALEL